MKISKEEFERLVIARHKLETLLGLIVDNIEEDAKSGYFNQINEVSLRLPILDTVCGTQFQLIADRKIEEYKNDK